MSILILSQALENYRELTNITWSNQRDYAERHGYDFRVYEGSYCALGYDYQRIQLIYDVLFKETLNKRYDAVWWLGSDVMIVNHTLRLEPFLQPEDKGLYICRDVHGLNNDSFVLRNTEWSRRWMQFVLDKEPEYRNDCWESQRVFQHFAETPEWIDGVSVLPHPSINSYFYDRYQRPETTPGHINKGDFVLHLPGMNLRERLDTFRSQRVADLIIK